MSKLETVQKKTRKKLYVLISLDVEEEGLFGGQYKRENVPLENVEYLPALEPLITEIGYPLTLFCAWSVFNSARARDILRQMQASGCEIGAHLHHWSTPPFQSKYYLCDGQPVRTHKLPEEILRSRLATLLETGRKYFPDSLTSFRMGRWDLKNILFPLLAEYGIKVDSSICPLRSFKNGACHFSAPVEPYWVDCGKYGTLLEAPVTQIPVLKGLPFLWQKMCGESQLDLFHFFGALSANPLWHGKLAMRLAAKLHKARGGLLLNLFWHSSEMMPGGSPKIANKKDAQKLLARIFSFCAWLKEYFNVIPVTASGLYAIAPALSLTIYSISSERDW